MYKSDYTLQKEMEKAILLGNILEVERYLDFYSVSPLKNKCQSFYNLAKIGDINIAKLIFKRCSRKEIKVDFNKFLLIIVENNNIELCEYVFEEIKNFAINFSVHTCVNTGAYIDSVIRYSLCQKDSNLDFFKSLIIDKKLGSLSSMSSQLRGKLIEDIFERSEYMAREDYVFLIKKIYEELLEGYDIFRDKAKIIKNLIKKEDYELIKLIIECTKKDKDLAEVFENCTTKAGLVLLDEYLFRSKGNFSNISKELNILRFAISVNSVQKFKKYYKNKNTTMDSKNKAFVGLYLVSNEDKFNAFFSLFDQDPDFLIKDEKGTINEKTADLLAMAILGRKVFIIKKILNFVEKEVILDDVNIFLSNKDMSDLFFWEDKLKINKKALYSSAMKDKKGFVENLIKYKNAKSMIEYPLLHSMYLEGKKLALNELLLYTCREDFMAVRNMPKEFLIFCKLKEF